LQCHPPELAVSNALGPVERSSSVTRACFGGVEGGAVTVMDKVSIPHLGHLCAGTEVDAVILPIEVRTQTNLRVYVCTESRESLGN
jgi:hypothetical protein